MSTQDLSLILLVAFSFLSFIDGVYIHLIHYRLHENKDSKKEHFLHSLRALFFLLTLVFVFYFESSGYWLLGACFIVFIDYIIESADMFEEKKSRSLLGGLSSFEYWLHGTLIMLRSLSLGLWFSSFSSSRFSLNESLLQLHLKGNSSIVVEQLMISTLLVVGLHFLLLVRPHFLERSNFHCCKYGATK